MLLATSVIATSPGDRRAVRDAAARRCCPLGNESRPTMLAQVVRVIDYGERQHVVIDGEQGRYHLTLQIATDHNNQVIGKKSWLRRDMLYPSEDAAIDAALADIARLEGRPLPDQSTPTQPTPTASPGREVRSLPQPRCPAPHPPA